MAFLDMSRPGSTGFFIFPIDTENPQSRIPHDYTRRYPLAPFERVTDARTFARLKAGVGAGSMAVVGLWPDEAVVKKYELIVGSETVFFINKTHLVAAATILHAERDRRLSDMLFGKGSPGTHELLLLLVDVRKLNMPLDRFYAALGRKTKAAFKHFTAVSPEAIKKMEENHGSVFSFLETAAG